LLFCTHFISDQSPLSSTKDIEKAFEYYVERQLALLRYEIFYEEENGYAILRGKEGSFDLSAADINEFHKSIRSYLEFKVHELMSKSRKF